MNEWWSFSYYQSLCDSTGFIIYYFFKIFLDIKCIPWGWYYLYLRKWAKTSSEISRRLTDLSCNQTRAKDVAQW
jgi:hypothetical protein